MKSEGTNVIVLDADGFTYLSGGNVGVGQAFGSTVDELLHLEKTAGTTIVKTEVAANSVVGFEIKKTNATTSNWRIVDGQTVNGDLEIYDVTDSRLITSFNGAGNVKFTGLVGVNKAINASVGLSVGSDAASSTSYGLEICNNNSNTRFLVDGLGSQRFYASDNSETARFTEGKLGIGDNDPFAALEVNDTGWSSGAPYGTVVYVEGGGVNDLNWGHLVVSQSGTTTDTGGRISLGANGQNPIAGIRAKYKGATYGDLAFLTRPSGGTNTERMLITSAGAVEMYQSLTIHKTVTGANDQEMLTIRRDGGATSDGARQSSIAFFDGNNDTYLAKISGYRESPAGNYNGGLRFYVNPHGTNANGTFAELNNTPVMYMNPDQTVTIPSGRLTVTINQASNFVSAFTQNNSSGYGLQVDSASSHLIFFYKNSSNIGNIQESGGNVVYGGTSDYRLKENIKYDFNATTELKKLKPCEFNFTAFENSTQNGFIAHELQEVVPKAVVGEKDAVDSDGNPIYQQVDPAKLVPLLVKTIQELEARIKTLEDA